MPRQVFLVAKGGVKPGQPHTWGPGPKIPEVSIVDEPATMLTEEVQVGLGMPIVKAVNDLPALPEHIQKMLVPTGNESYYDALYRLQQAARQALGSYFGLQGWPELADFYWACVYIGVDYLILSYAYDLTPATKAYKAFFQQNANGDFAFTFVPVSITYQEQEEGVMPQANTPDSPAPAEVSKNESEGTAAVAAPAATEAPAAPEVPTVDPAKPVANLATGLLGVQQLLELAKGLSGPFTVTLDSAGALALHVNQALVSGAVKLDAPVAVPVAAPTETAAAAPAVTPAAEVTKSLAPESAEVTALRAELAASQEAVAKMVGDVADLKQRLAGSALSGVTPTAPKTETAKPAFVRAFANIR